MLGRDGELAELRSTLAVAATGAGSCVVVEGPAGIGKTRVLTAAAGAGAELGLVVASGQATELDRVAPLAALLTALRTSRPPVLNDATWAELREQQGKRPSCPRSAPPRTSPGCASTRVSPDVTGC